MNYPYINIHTHKKADDDGYIVAGVTLRCMGVHPWRAAEEDIAARLEQIATAPVAAIGETGLDFAVDVDREKQREVFEAQLVIAARRSLPVIIHCVKAYNEVEAMLRPYTLPAIIFHGFTGSPQLASALADAGYFLSFGRRSLSSPTTINAINSIPQEKIFLETDMAQTPIEDIYILASRALNIPIGELKKQVYDNFKTIF